VAELRELAGVVNVVRIVPPTANAFMRRKRIFICGRAG
jgi:hypothetical protein